MEDVLEEVVSSEDLQKFEKIFHEELHQGNVTHKTQFEYAWCLVRSRYSTDMKKGILLLKELFNSHPEGKRDYLFYLAIGNARIKEYNKALHFVKQFLEIEPTNQQVLDLQNKIEKKMQHEGIKGMAIAGGTALAIGAVVALGVSLISKSKK